MPVVRGEDKDGPFYRWGSSGRKYYFSKGNEESRKRARARAEKQGRAARASGYGKK